MSFYSFFFICLYNSPPSERLCSVYSCQSYSRTIISAFSPLTSISKMCDCMRCGIPLWLSAVPRYLALANTMRLEITLKVLQIYICSFRCRRKFIISIIYCIPMPSIRVVQEHFFTREIVKKTV